MSKELFLTNLQKDEVTRFKYFTFKLLNSRAPLKELRNHMGKLFLCPPQKQAKTQPTFSTAIFRAKFTSWPIKLNTYMQEIKFALHKQYLIGLVFSKKQKKTRTDP